MIDPRDLIMGPFVACPVCGEAAVGILDVHEDRYHRCCRQCRHSDICPLPAIAKRVIYLDQFAISEMMKVLNPTTSAHRAGRVDRRWRELFDTVHWLSRAQLVVFPSSEFHRSESLMSWFYEPLRTMYDHLSGGVEFKSSTWVEQVQLHQHGGSWLSGAATIPLLLDTPTVVYGTVNGWWERIRFQWNSRLPEEVLQQLRAARAVVHEQSVALVEKWRAEGRSFDDTYRYEVNAVGPTILGERGAPPARLLVYTLQNAFRAAGVLPEQIDTRVRRYLQSAPLDVMPFVRIGAMLWAAVARKYSVGGRRKPPTQGLVTDIRMMSALLPYCDAMFVDNEIAGYLRDEPLASALAGYAKVFSPRSFAEFRGYLDAIGNAAPPEHLALVNEIYGPHWMSPVQRLYADA